MRNVLPSICLFSEPCCTGLRLCFADECDFEEGCDILWIWADENKKNKLATYTGNSHWQEAIESSQSCQLGLEIRTMVT